MADKSPRRPVWLWTVLRLLVVAAIAWVLIAKPAKAQQTAAVQIRGTLEKACTALAPADQTITLSGTEPQAVGALSYSCNFVGTPSLRLWSLNGGALVAPASAGNGNVAQSLPYAVLLGGEDLGQLTSTLASAKPVQRSLDVAGLARGEAVTIKLAHSASVAGVYVDAINLSVTP